MKKITITLFCLLIVGSKLLHAQIGKGKMMFGAGFSYSDLNSSGSPTYSVLDINALIGFFVSNRIALGPIIGYTKQSQAGNELHAFNFGMIVRPYLYKNAFLDITGLYHKEELVWPVRGGTNSEELQYFSFGLGAGYSFFLNNHIAFEPGFYYRRFIAESNHGTRLSFQLGLQIFLGQENQNKAN